MRKFILYNLLFGLFFVCITDTSAQTPAENRKKTIEKFKQFPINIRFSQDYVSSGNYKMEKNDILINEGSFTDAFRTSLQLSMPVHKSKMGIITLGGFYDFHNIEFIPRRTDENSWHPNMGHKHHTWGLQSTYILTSRLWDKQFTGMANIKGEFSEEGAERITGIAVGTLQIRKTEHSSLGVGAVLLVNTSSPWPLFPIVVYHHQFDKKWSLNLMLPQLYINYRISQKDKFAAGLSIFGEHFYVTPNHKELPTTCLYSRSNFRPEVVYEHNINDLTKFFIKSGATICINSRLYSSGGNTKYVNISQNPSIFLQIGLSYGISSF